MKYNILISIEVADDKNDNYVELKDEQILLGSFDSLEKAMEFMDDTGKATIIYHQGKMFNCEEL